MNLKKKTSIWKYIMRLDCVRYPITVIGAVIGAVAIVLAIRLLGRLGYLIFPSAVFELLNLSVHKPGFMDYFIVGLCILLAIFLVGCLLLCIVHFVKKHMIILSVLRAAVYIPLSKDELEENGIHTMDDMTEFLTSNVFKDVRHGVRVHEIYSELRTCYSLVYRDRIFNDDTSEAVKEMLRDSDLHYAARNIIEWLYDEYALTRLYK